MKLLVEPIGNFEVMSDGRAVWVNSASGICIGRFSIRGIDIHHDVKVQIDSDQQCLDCKTGPCGEADWEYFRIGMRAAYGVEISDIHMPMNLMVAA